MIPYYLRLARGYPAYLICFYTPLDRLSWKAYLWLLPWAGDFAYRKEYREWLESKRKETRV